jgi:hypothetical protein
LEAATEILGLTPEAARAGLERSKTNAEDAERYRHLRTRDLGSIHSGGVFAGLTPDNLILNGHSLDSAIDKQIGSAPIPSLNSVLERFADELRARWEPPTELCSDPLCGECSDNRTAMALAGAIDAARQRMQEGTK